MDILLPAIKKSLMNANHVTQVRINFLSKSDIKEYINLLSAIVGILPEEFPELHTLKSTTDLEVDFFSNITHIQLHRRAKALKRFQKLARKHKFQPVCIFYVVRLVIV